MKILGIGNAIVDVICKVEDDFLFKNDLNKGSMKLIFEQVEFEKLLNNLKIEKTVSGGSVANSIVGLSQLGNKAGFIGKISDDEFGIKYEEGLNKEKVNFLYTKKKGGTSNWNLFNFSYTRFRKDHVYIPRYCWQNQWR